MTTETEVIDLLVAKWGVLFPQVQLLGVDKDIPVATLAGRRYDLVLHVQVGDLRHELVCEVKSLGEPRYLHQAISTLKANTGGRGDMSPAVVAPYIPEEGRALCRDAGINYLDLAGNIFLRFDHVLIDKTTPYKPRRGRGSGAYDMFAAISSRVLRVLLERPRHAWKFASLSEESGVSLRTAYRVVTTLAERGYVDKHRGAMTLSKPAGLLDLWAENYRVGLSTVRTYYSLGRTFRAFANQVNDLARDERFTYAFTLHAGASLVAPFVRFTDVHFYLDGDTDRLVEALDLRPVEAGGTIHILQPYDAGVFYNLQEADGFPVVCNTQLYLDLVNYPARGREQAEFLRREKMSY
jgi:hypothetical protein